jgi:hypothetical protein
MNDAFRFNHYLQKIRWVAYFDLLGVSSMVKSGNIDEVFRAYERSVRELKNLQERAKRVMLAWFSDTFLLYTEDDSCSSFINLEYVSRWFLHYLVSAEIPVRGSIACGELYADSVHNVYMGGALIESHEYGEAQDWIGFVFCPSAEEQLEKLRLPARERLHYKHAAVPWKKGSRQKEKGETAYAIVPGSHAKSNFGENLLLPPLKRMKSRQSNLSVIKKYDNTIEFIENRTEKTGGVEENRQAQ